jgi:hypothetical protein
MIFWLYFVFYQEIQKQFLGLNLPQYEVLLMDGLQLMFKLEMSIAGLQI